MEKHKYLDIILATCIFKNTALTGTNKRYLKGPLFLFTDLQYALSVISNYMVLNNLLIL